MKRVQSSSAIPSSRTHASMINTFRFASDVIFVAPASRRACLYRPRLAGYFYYTVPMKIVIFLVSFFLSLPLFAGPEADLIIKNAMLYTMEGTPIGSQSIAVLADKIVA